MVTLALKDSGRFLGTIDDADFQFLMDKLEEESNADSDYYISLDTISFLAAGGASDTLLTILKDAVGSLEGVEVSWKKV